jgi:hypothetical protein
MHQTIIDWVLQISHVSSLLALLVPSTMKLLIYKLRGCRETVVGKHGSPAHIGVHVQY